MRTEDIIKWGAIAIGAWWLIKELGQGGSLSHLVGGGQPVGATGETTVIPDSPPPPQLPAGNIPTDQTVSNQPTSPVYNPPTDQQPPPASSYSPAVQQIIASAGGNSGLTFDQWNYFYQQATGNSAPAPEDVGVTRTSPMPPMTIDQWLAAVQGRVDLSGLRGMGRLFSVLHSGVPQGGWSQ